MLLLCIVLSALALVAQGKVSECRNMLNNYDRDFFYCTKFSVGKGQPFKSFLTA